MADLRHVLKVRSNKKAMTAMGIISFGDIQNAISRLKPGKKDVNL